MSLDVLFGEVSSWITPYLQDVFVDSEISNEDVTVKASLYSLLAGGKRIRPVFMYAVSKMLDINPDVIKPYAGALEMIHTYSLIHDDLPAMDNDDLRRGKPTCHKVYGEGIALLAGDCLLNRAHEILLLNSLNGTNYAKASLSISTLAGIKGMIGGQSIDLSSEGQSIELMRLYELQQKKTGALLKAAICTPLYFVEDCKTEVSSALNDLAEHIGLAFQIKDDILDVESNPDVLGKSTGKDERDMKSTFVTLLGLEEAKNKLNEEINLCYTNMDILSNCGYDVSLLKELTAFMVERDY